jgi:hypothetical protein
MDYHHYLYSRTICAFLNSGRGGLLIIGANDDGQVIGLRMTIEQVYSISVIWTMLYCLLTIIVVPTLQNLLFFFILSFVSVRTS